jgi:hypothetical protein
VGDGPGEEHVGANNRANRWVCGVWAQRIDDVVFRKIVVERLVVGDLVRSVRSLTQSFRNEPSKVVPLKVT